MAWAAGSVAVDLVRAVGLTSAAGLASAAGLVLADGFALAADLVPAAGSSNSAPAFVDVTALSDCSASAGGVPLTVDSTLAAAPA